MHTWWPLKGKPQELFLGPGPPSLCLHTVAVLAAAERDPPGSTWRTARFVQGSHLSFGGTCQNCFHLSALPPVKPPTDTQAKPRAPHASLAQHAPLVYRPVTRCTALSTAGPRSPHAPAQLGGGSSSSSGQTPGFGRRSFAESSGFTRGFCAAVRVASVLGFSNHMTVLNLYNLSG